jgi:hypothetical protein
MKLTEKELAKALGIPRMTVKRWGYHRFIKPVSRKPRLYDLGQVKQSIRECAAA